MNEFIKKLIDRFKEVGNIQFFSYTKPLIAVEDAIKIINQAAEEYAADINVGNKDSAKVNQEPKTRIECLRSMSVEELADRILVSSAIVEIDFCQNISKCDDITTHNGAIPDEMCKKCLVKWLNSPEKQKEEIPDDHLAERFSRVL